MSSHTLTFFEPGHFHAALLLRSPTSRIHPTIHVYATQGPDLDRFLALIDGFNSRSDDPTAWDVQVHRAPGDTAISERTMLDKLIDEHRGSPVVIAGRNEPKLAAIRRLHDEGFAVLVDKPWIVSLAGLPDLQQVTAGKPRVMDLMTGRHDIVNHLCRQIVADRELFGEFAGAEQGKPDLEFGSIHHLCKRVDGRALIRPPWCYDVHVQGDGLVDIHSHMVDQAQWLIDYRQAGSDDHQSSDDGQDLSPIQLERAERWSTRVPLVDFSDSTGLDRFPDVLTDRLSGSRSSPVLDLACNGLIEYRLGHALVHQQVVWRVRAEDNGSDVHTFKARGTGCTLTVNQGMEPGGGPVLHLKPVDTRGWPQRLSRRLAQYQNLFPGLTAEALGDGHRLQIPPALATPHETTFCTVLNEFLDRLESGLWSKSSAKTIRDRYELLAEAQRLARTVPTPAE